MKTPRELLLERHRSEGSRLDAIRRDVLVAVQPASAGEPHRQAQPRRAASSLLALLLPFRWHLAGMSAAWLITAFLNMDSATEVGIARTDGPSPQQILASLRENRRQITELTGPPVQAGEAIPAPRIPAPRRRSESESNCAMA